MCHCYNSTLISCFLLIMYYCTHFFSGTTTRYNHIVIIFIPNIFIDFLIVAAEVGNVHSAGNGLLFWHLIIFPTQAKRVAGSFPERRVPLFLSSLSLELRCL